MIILALLLAAVLCASCTKVPVQDGGLFRAQEIDFPIVLADRQNENCCYLDGKTAIFVIRDRNGAPTGPLYDTQYFCLMEDFAVKKIFNINSERLIYYMVPYRDGILYIDVAYEDGGAQAEQYYVNWTLKWITPEQTVSITEGKGDGSDEVPRLFLLDGVPHYLWKAWDGSGAFGISKVEGTESIPVFTERDYYMQSMPSVVCNGKQYAFDVSRKDDTCATMLVGNAAGIQYTHALNGVITSYGINDSYLVCGLGSDRSDPENSEYSVLSLSLKDGKAETFSVDFPIWRLCGSGAGFLGVDSGWNMLAVDVAKRETVSLPRPQGGGYAGDPVRLSAMGNDRYLVRFEKTDYVTMEDAYVYFKLTMK